MQKGGWNCVIQQCSFPYRELEDRCPEVLDICLINAGGETHF